MEDFTVSTKQNPEISGLSSAPEDIFDVKHLPPDFTGSTTIKNFLYENLEISGPMGENFIHEDHMLSDSTSSVPSYRSRPVSPEDNRRIINLESLGKCEAEVATRKQENEALQQMQAKLKTMEEMVSDLQQKHHQETEKGNKGLQELEKRLNNMRGTTSLGVSFDGGVGELIKQLTAATHEIDQADLKTRSEFVTKRTTDLQERFVMNQEEIEAMTDDLLREMYNNFKQAPSAIAELEKEPLSCLK